MEVQVRIRELAGAMLGATALAVVPLTAVGGSPAAASDQSFRHCQEVNVPAELPGAHSGQFVEATYCLPYGRHPSKIDVLVPGGTYDHAYWDWPQNPALYSYADKTLLAGRAVLAIDRLGTGDSSFPHAGEMTLAADVGALHRVVSWARAVAGFGDVNVIAHSLGSIVAADDAAAWPGDPTRLVLTGFLHASSSNVGVLLADLVSAHGDPVLAGTSLGQLDPGYLTTLPGTRGQLFYFHADPLVVAYDEAHKDVLSSTELGDVIRDAGAGTTLITAPVLLAVGQDDWLFCEGTGAADCSSPVTVRQAELPRYASAASLSAIVVPATGHDLALSPTARLSFAMINAWLNSPRA
jgi:pimeloyl-ACP methyl ester carboxylesterase